MNRAMRRATTRRIAKEMRASFGCTCTPRIAPIEEQFSSDVVDELAGIADGGRLYDTLHQPGCPVGAAGADAIANGCLLVGLGTAPAPRRCDR